MSKNMYAPSSFQRRLIFLGFPVLLAAIGAFIFREINADTFSYIDAATFLWRDHVFASRIITGAYYFDHIRSIPEYITVWPPGYSFAIALIKGFTGLSPRFAAYIVNIISYALLLDLTRRYFLVRGHTEQTATERMLWISFLPVVFQNARLPMSDLTFLALLTAALHLMPTHLEDKTPKPHSYLLAGIVSSAACLTRYLGIILIPTVTFWILVQKYPLKKRLTGVGYYLTTSIVPTSLWLLRNYQVGEHFFGGRPWAWQSPLL